MQTLYRLPPKIRKELQRLLTVYSEIRYAFIRDFFINGLHIPSVSLKMAASQRTPNTAQNLCNGLIFYANRDSSSNFNATILKFSEKFDHPFLHVFILNW